MYPNSRAPQQLVLFYYIILNLRLCHQITQVISLKALWRSGYRV
jgi:hypothetical protein